MSKTTIEWCDYTFNPRSGCSKVSPGCANCYAEVNYSVKVRGVKWGPQGNRIVKAESGWKEPLKWNADAGRSTILDAETPNGRVHIRPRVFCASLADVFEDWKGPITTASGARLAVDRRDGGWYETDLRIGQNIATMDDVRTRLFKLIHKTQNLDWLILTKRAEEMAEYVRLATDSLTGLCAGGHFPVDFPNVWLGVSVENQKCLIDRWDILRDTPAAIRFLSAEPLLGALNLTPVFDGMTKPDWIIVGGESGPGSRPCNIEWIRDILRQCKAAGVPCFVKQVGSLPMLEEPITSSPQTILAHGIDWREGTRFGNRTGNPQWNGRQIFLRDKKGGDPAEWPNDLAVREFPK